MCGELSSYSDACSSIVLTYHNEIYTAVKNDFTKRNVCMLSGMCSESFHPHADGFEVRILFLLLKLLCYRIWLFVEIEKRFDGC